MSSILAKESVPEFTLGGNATITIRSSSLAKRYTYKIQQHKDDKNLYFIKLLRGQDNENDYSYIGCYYSDTQYFHPCKTWKFEQKENWPHSIKMIDFFFKHLYNLPDRLEVYHEGKCARCGRKLTTPESIKSGFGPECRRFVV